MPVDYNVRKGIDHPLWEWLAQNPLSITGHGAGNAYDGTRYMYFATSIQTGTSSTATTHYLYRYDTHSDAWQYMASLTNGAAGIDLEHDPIRNVLYITHGAALTSWQVFNLNTTAVVIANVTCNPQVATTMTPVLPIAAGLGGSITMPDDRYVSSSLAVDGSTPVDTGNTAGTGSTATNILNNTANEGTFGPGMVGLNVRFTSGVLAGQRRVITAVNNPHSLTTVTFTAAPAVGDAYIVEVPEHTASSGTTTTLTYTGAGWTTNLYANSDVVIIAGTGSGQRRRIASNTADTLTLATAVTGNARTGAWTTFPDATSIFRIVPSSDFLYYQPGGSTTSFYRLDVVQTTGAAWSAALAVVPATVGGGGNTVYPQAYAPFQILCFRGNGGNQYFAYNLGLNTWMTPTQYPMSEVWSTGASTAMIHGKRRMFVTKDSSVRSAMLNLTNGTYEPFPQLPYANPSAYDGKRTRFVKTADGAGYLYHWRAGGQEFFRIALEWM